jgi:hypothetical protein
MMEEERDGNEEAGGGDRVYREGGEMNTSFRFHTSSLHLLQLIHNALPVE